LPAAVANVLAACGKVKKTAQVPYLLAAGGAEAAEPRQAVATVDPETVRAAQEIVARYRSGMGEVVTRAALPHDLPPTAEALGPGLGTASGPRKPALEQVFKPLG
jgi:hypothetical protein